MKIHLKNEINLGDETEIIEQVFPLQLTAKQDSIYLTYTNEEGENVLIKAQPTSLMMTRFSNPKTVMRFTAAGDAEVQLPSPLGIQRLLSRTSTYELDRENQTICLAYALLVPQTEAVLADYRLKIAWTED